MKLFHDTHNKDVEVVVLYDDGNDGLTADAAGEVAMTYAGMVALVDAGTRFIVRTETEDLMPVKVAKVAASGGSAANVTVSCINTVSTALAFVTFTVEDDAE